MFIISFENNFLTISKIMYIVIWNCIILFSISKRTCKIMLDEYLYNSKIKISPGLIDYHIFSFNYVSKLDLPRHIIRRYVRVYSRADINYDTALHVIHYVALVFLTRENLSSTNARCIFISVRAFWSRERRLRIAKLANAHMWCLKFNKYSSNLLPLTR